MGVSCALGRLSFAGADEVVTCQVIFAKANSATMELAEVPVDVIPDALVAFGEHCKDARMIRVVVVLLDCFGGEDMSF